MNTTANRSLLQQAIRPCLLVAAVWAVAVLIGWIFQPDAFYRAYLHSWLLYLGIALGSLGVVMLHNLTGGEWGWTVRRLAEQASMTLPLLALLFIPVLIGIHHLFPWAKADELAHDAVLRHRRPYMNPGLFFVRFLIYFLIWTATAWYLHTRSLRYDRTSDPQTEKDMHDVSAISMLIYFITMSFAAVDWIMSLEPHWSSTIFGWQVIAGQAVTGVSFLVVILALLAPRPPFDVLVRPKHFNDLASLLLTAVILWSYLTFVQLLVTWMGDKQDEVPWFTQRLNHGWFLLGCAIVLFHFFVPFFTLLMRSAKQKRTAMLTLCSGLLIVRAIDNFWMVSPSGDDRLPYLWHRFSWMDLVFPIGMGGLWLAAFLWRTAGEPLIAEGDVVALAEPQPA